MPTGNGMCRNLTLIVTGRHVHAKGEFVHILFIYYIFNIMKVAYYSFKYDLFKKQ